MLIDMHEDKRQSEDWLNQDSEPDLDATAIAEQLFHGFEDCGAEFCGSREICGSDACYCIRAQFKSKAHYDLYCELRPQHAKVLAMALLAKAVKIHAVEELND